MPEKVQLAHETFHAAGVADVVHLIHGDALRPFIDRVLGDPRVDALIVPIGKGELVCRKA